MTGERWDGWDEEDYVYRAHVERDGDDLMERMRDQQELVDIADRACESLDRINEAVIAINHIRRSA